MAVDYIGDALKSASTGAAAGTAVAPGIGTAIGAGVGALAGIGMGIYQHRKGKKLAEENVRPEYQIPEEILQNLSQAQHMALQGLPEEQKAQYIQNLMQGGQAALTQMGSRKAGLSGVAQLNQQQNLGFQNLLAQDAAARQANQQGLMQQRQNVAGYRDQEFQLNQLNPYYEKEQQAQGLLGAGLQNIGTQVGNLGYMAGRAFDANQGNADPSAAASVQGGNQLGLRSTGTNPNANQGVYGAGGGLTQRGYNTMGMPQTFGGAANMNIAPRGTTQGVDANGNPISVNPYGYQGIQGLNITPSTFR